MEILFIIILGAIAIVLATKRPGKNQEQDMLIGLNNIIKEMMELRREVKQLKSNVQDSVTEIKSLLQNATQRNDTPAAPAPVNPSLPAAETPPVPNKPISHSSIFIVPEDIAEQPPIEAETTEREHTETLQDIFDQELTAPAAQTTEQPGVHINERPNVTPPIWEEQESFLTKWLRNNPDLEKFIGENLVNKIGIAVLVLGIAFFVKYAIDQDWINEVGRVCIGMGCGALLVGLAHYMRNTYRSFSSVLAGGGIAVFYFTIAFGFHQYHLMPQAAAFVIMVVITAFAIALSVLYNKLELAIIATIGGFLAPFLVSTGDGNYIVLFTYLIILNVGVLSLAYFKRWPAINIIALAFTEIIYAGWLVSVAGSPATQVSYPIALLFATAFYFIFLGMNMINQMKNKAHFKPFDFAILLLISSTYFAAGITLLHYCNNGAYQGLFTLALGCINLLLTYYVYKNSKADRNLLFLLIGITLTFITLTIPIQLHGHAITLFWSAEFVLLYWLSEYSGIRLFKYSSFLLCGLTIISLTMDWEKAGDLSNSHLAIIYNDMQGLVTNLIATAAFTALFFLLRKNRDDNFLGLSNAALSRAAIFIAGALLYVTCIFGVNLYYQELASYVVPGVYHTLITEAFALVLLVLLQRRIITLSPWYQFSTLCICFLFLLSSAGNVLALRNDILYAKAPWVHLYFHWLGSVLLVIIFYRVIQAIRRQPEVFGNAVKALTISIIAMVITFLSIEMLHLYVIAGHNRDNIGLFETQYYKAGLTVVWALCSFALMWLGMKHSTKLLRIISLVLFAVVLLKLFLIDISGISEGGKILAFILLGVLLLVVSFMYQKLKKIIIDVEKD